MRPVLFVHPPRRVDGLTAYTPVPQGLVALAAIADRPETPARIAHVGPGGFVDDVEAAAHAAGLAPAVIFVSLHYLDQATDALRLIATFSRRLPGVPVAAGGLTASIFAHELLVLAPGLSAVIRGDGEAAVAAIARRLRAGGRTSFADVPNAAWRTVTGAIRDHGMPFSLSPRGAARLAHARFDLLARPREHLAADPDGPAFHYDPGRGCTYGCVHCGGSRVTQMIAGGRIGYFFFGRTKVVRDLAAAREHGLSEWRASFDPGRRRDEWPRLLAAVVRAGQRWRITFEAWTPPPKELVEAIARAALPGSRLVLSPEIGNERLRCALKGASHTDALYDEAIAAARARGIAVRAWVTAGLPRETPRDVEETMVFARRLRERHGVEVRARLPALAPGSRLFLHPKRHAVRILWRTLRESLRGDHPVGYETAAFTEEAIVAAVAALAREAG